MRVSTSVVLAVTLAACGSTTESTKRTVARDESEADDGSPFSAPADFKPKAFAVRVRGEGRPIIFIPGLGCPGEVWDGTVVHLVDQGYQTHVLTLAGFADQPPIEEPLSKAVRRDLTRYIRSRKLDHPVIVGHSMGGFIAYWIASYHPELVGPTIVVDASPALSGDLDTAKELRAKWKYASDEEFTGLIRAAFFSMTSARKRMEKTVDLIVKSDRLSIGNAIYEMVVTDLRDKVNEIQAPVLIIAADGGLQYRIRKQVETIPNYEMVVLKGTHHFVFYDDPEAFYKTIDKFLEDHPPKS